MAGRGKRNNDMVDWWSATHVAWGLLLGWLMDPFWALLLLILWEPLELFVLSPLSLKITGREFGHEGVANSLSDLLFDAAGVVAGAYLLRLWFAPPFVLFS